MNFSYVMRLGSAALLAAVVAGCGGGGGGGGAAPAPAPAPGGSTPTVQQAIASAAAVADNDTSSNSSASFSVVQSAGVPAVTVASPPKVNFTVFSDGAVKKGLTLSNVSMAIAKLVPGSNGDPDKWVNYVSRKEVATAGKGPGNVPVLPEAWQATTDPKDSLVENADGYYTYTFKADIKDPAWTAVVNNVTYSTNGATYEPSLTHRIAIQLSYTNAAGETVRVNPYYDFTLDASGNSVPVTDPSKTRKMTDVSSCNGCHEKLALHGGGRVDTQFCVMCHNPGTTDANSGHVLILANMVHKIHSGRLLKSQLDAGKGGEDYTIWGFRDSKHDYAEVGFPQDLRNCTKCHSADPKNPTDDPGRPARTPQGDNWKTVVTKQACLTCHANKVGSDWNASHELFARDAGVVGPNPNPLAKATDLTNAQCAACHKPGSNIASERVHWNQNEENAAKYKMNIETVTLVQAPSTTATGSVQVKYYLSDPTNGGAKYKLEDDPAKFGSLYLYLAYQSLPGQSTAVTEFTSYNNPSNSAGSARVTAISGTNDGTNVYTNTITIPVNLQDTTDPAKPKDIRVASGTARVVSIGQIREPKLEVKWATDPRPEVVPADTVNTVVQNTWKEFAITGPLTPRRTIVATEKCNVCHGALGTTSGSNTLANAFHGGARNIVEACVTCHDPNRMSSTVMTNGLALNESYQFKRMIHGIHGNSKRTYPFTHGNPVRGAFGKDGTLPLGGSFLADYSIRGFTPTPAGPVVAAGTAVAANSTFQSIGDLITAAARTVGYTGSAVSFENYAAEVAWPGVGINCNVCHVDNSYKVDRGPVGSVVSQPAGVTDPLGWLTISPKAATCTACHDSSAAISHVTSFGAANHAGRAGGGDATQKSTMLGSPTQVGETCSDCHASGGFKGVDIVHGQK
ncbi:MAG: OmcA/MtrC family decaheme c-type cytochrome [Rhizobacter sp.]|nr:OmcA/MtrC family decaheme c-type cytochrome [Rhizobacter sp.]